MEQTSEMRKKAAIEAGAEAIKNDVPASKETPSLAEGPAAEFAKEAQEELKASLEQRFDDAVSEVMMLSDLSTDTAVGKAFFDAANKDKDAYVQAAFNEIMFQHLPLDQGQSVLEQLLGKSLEANKAN